VLKRDQGDWDWRLRFKDSPNAIGCTYVYNSIWVTRHELWLNMPHTHYVVRLTLQRTRQYLDSHNGFLNSLKIIPSKFTPSVWRLDFTSCFKYRQVSRKTCMYISMRVIRHGLWLTCLIHIMLDESHGDVHVCTSTHVMVCWMPWSPLARGTQCVAMCCSALECVAGCCSVLHCVAVCCSVLQ